MESSEKELLDGLRSKETSALRRLYELYKDQVYRICKRILCDVHDAEDATQEAFISIYRNIDKFRMKSSLKTWIHKITINCALKKQEKQKRFSSLLSKIESEPGALDPKGTKSDVTNIIHEALLKLPAKLRVCLVLRIEGLDYRELSETLDIPIGTVMSRLNSARKELKEFLRHIE